MKLIRDFNTKKNKKQEERFLNTENFSLFFDSEKEIYGFDQWLPQSVNKIMKYMPEDIIIYFSNWNKTIEDLFVQKKPALSIIKSDLDNKFTQVLKDKNIIEVKKILEELDNNQKVIALFICLSFLPQKDTLKNIKLINKSINTRILSTKILLNLFILKIMGSK